jgi:hypothetical protein
MVSSLARALRWRHVSRRLHFTGHVSYNFFIYFLATFLMKYSYAISMLSDICVPPLVNLND